jgi:16S rRNA (cytosine967-C5)-methyltransferase
VEKADVVLADLPCSGLGVIGKKQDIKYRITKEAISELVKLQRQILDVVWRYVKPGGVLVYSTCTMNPDENEKTVRWFAENYSFEPESLSPYLAEELKKEGEEGMLQLFPGLHETDGFFIARMRRKG